MDFVIIFAFYIIFIFHLFLSLFASSFFEDYHTPFSQSSTLFLHLSLIFFLNIACILLVFPQILILAAWTLAGILGSFVWSAVLIGVASLQWNSNVIFIGLLYIFCMLFHYAVYFIVEGFNALLLEACHIAREVGGGLSKQSDAIEVGSRPIHELWGWRLIGVPRLSRSCIEVIEFHNLLGDIGFVPNGHFMNKYNKVYPSSKKAYPAFRNKLKPL